MCRRLPVPSAIMAAAMERTKELAGDRPTSDGRSARGDGIPAAAVSSDGNSGTPVEAFDYDLPEAAIAQEPVEPRSAARLLVAPSVGAEGGVSPAHRHITDLPDLLRPGDLLVVNDTRVLAARLQLAKSTGGRAEVLLLEPEDGSGRGVGSDEHDSGSDRWVALVRPGRRLPPGTALFEAGGSAGTAPVVVEGWPERTVPGGGYPDGRRIVRLADPSIIERAGIVPLPPYIHAELDRPERYQTVLAAARPPGERSAAAPTAGLHLTPEVLEACRTAGAAVATVDLVIGLDTFRPLSAPTVEGHVMHSERYRVPAATWEACRSATRVVAVGTTVVRALESVAATGELEGRTDLFIRPGFRFRMVDALLTNFHLPRSSLLVLVEAFYGPAWRDRYAEALAAGYRFLSFGDAMFLERGAGHRERDCGAAGEPPGRPAHPGPNR